jgi:hypothetical protein
MLMRAVFLVGIFVLASMGCGKSNNRDSQTFTVPVGGTVTYDAASIEEGDRVECNVAGTNVSVEVGRPGTVLSELIGGREGPGIEVTMSQDGSVVAKCTD